jgi:hypothetical protein
LQASPSKSVRLSNIVEYNSLSDAEITRQVAYKIDNSISVRIRIQNSRIVADYVDQVYHKRDAVESRKGELGAITVVFSVKEMIAVFVP